MKRLIKHIRKWNAWRKHSLNSKLDKLLVLFGVIQSPSMNYLVFPEIWDEAMKVLEKEINSK